MLLKEDLKKFNKHLSLIVSCTQIKLTIRVQRNNKMVMALVLYKLTWVESQAPNMIP